MVWNKQQEEINTEHWLLNVDFFHAKIAGKDICYHSKHFKDSSGKFKYGCEVTNGLCVENGFIFKLLTMKKDDFASEYLRWKR